MLELVIIINIISFIVLLIGFRCSINKSNRKIFTVLHSDLKSDEMMKKAEKLIKSLGVVLVVVIIPLWLYSLYELLKLIF